MDFKVTLGDLLKMTKGPGELRPTPLSLADLIEAGDRLPGRREPSLRLIEAAISDAGFLATFLLYESEAGSFDVMLRVEDCEARTADLRLMEIWHDPESFLERVEFFVFERPDDAGLPPEELLVDLEVPVGYCGLLAGDEVSTDVSDITTYVRRLGLRADSGSTPGSPGLQSA